MGIALLLVLGGVFMLFANKGITGDVINDDQEINVEGVEIQKIILSMKDYNYYPQTIKVKAVVPVSISLDSSVVGCYRAFTIPELKISKNFRASSDTLEFTPTKKGTYKFACTMGMGTGTMIVE
jgi:plastocyanin domain-containing protein